MECFGTLGARSLRWIIEIAACSVAPMRSGRRGGHRAQAGV
ncbi:hypothetical protein LC55x_3572 [Lysobacter capsici]|nr:hypothetical protein LC55x_3572 [Lysobacter capsici]